jgi:folate-binding protein YgfZ
MSKTMNNPRIALLDNRTALKVTGKDRFPFLQNLISQDIGAVEAGKPAFSAFLTPQGKYIAEFFIVPEGDELYLDVDAESASDFVTRLSRYKLRNDVNIEGTNIMVYAVWDGAVDKPHVFADPRLPQLGQRMLATNHTRTLPVNAEHSEYTNHRYVLGVAEGPHEIAVNDATLLEVNFDALNAISFEKGCYLGQELTARTHYRGLIKRRYLPFRFEGTPPTKFEHISHNRFEVGEIKALGDGVGLGLFHLEAVQPFINGEPLVHHGTTFEIYVPEWLKSKMPQPEKAKA